MNTTVEYVQERFGDDTPWLRFIGYQDDEGGLEIRVRAEGGPETVLSRDRHEAGDLYRFLQKVMAL